MKVVALQQMNTINLTIPVPEDMMAALNESAEGVKKEITLSAALWLYLNQRLSLAKAATLAGYKRVDFETYLSQHKIPISLTTVDEILNDAKKIQA
jgi:predicted HTH domain antitoxin